MSEVQCDLRDARGTSLTVFGGRARPANVLLLDIDPFRVVSDNSIHGIAQGRKAVVVGGETVEYHLVETMWHSMSYHDVLISVTHPAFIEVIKRTTVLVRYMTTQRPSYDDAGDQAFPAFARYMPMMNPQILF